jgi:predicted metalloprotease
MSVAIAERIWTGRLRANDDDASGRTSGDFSVAYAIAHEYAHAMQHELGVIADDPTAQRFATAAVELHADCWAGVWANSAYYQGVLQPGDVQEGIDAAALVGDYAYGDPRHHGTPAERAEAFLAGYDNGAPRSCGTYLKSDVPDGAQTFQPRTTGAQPADVRLR